MDVELLNLIKIKEKVISNFKNLLYKTNQEIINFLSSKIDSNNTSEFNIVFNFYAKIRDNFGENIRKINYILENYYNLEKWINHYILINFTYNIYELIAIFFSMLEYVFDKKLHNTKILYFIKKDYIKYKKNKSFCDLRNLLIHQNLVYDSNEKIKYNSATVLLSFKDNCPGFGISDDTIAINEYELDSGKVLIKDGISELIKLKDILYKVFQEINENIIKFEKKHNLT